MPQDHTQDQWVTKTRDPKIEILELRDDFIKFVLYDTDTSVANALRRAMIAEVPTMAIDLVYISENTSVVLDEFLAHRLGLLPLRVEPGVQFNYRHECECEDTCAQCCAMLELNVTFEEKSRDRPEHERDMPVHVTTEDLIPADLRVRPVNFREDDRPHDFGGSDKGIMIAKLAKGQAIKLQCEAVKGIAKEHAKWSPCAVATYAFDPIVEINQAAMLALDQNQRQELADCCPTQVYGIEEDTGDLYVRKREACMYCDECVYMAKDFKKRPEDDPVVEVRPRNDRFTFSVETTGSMAAADIVSQGLQCIQAKLRMFQDEVGPKRQNDMGDYDMR